MGRADCYCGKNHANERLGWTVVRTNSVNGREAKCGFKVYKRDCPADEAHFAADLAPFTHKSKKLAREAGKAGHFAYAKMYHIYIGSGSTPDLHNECRLMLEERYPHLTFDSDVVEGVSGVRFHTTKYDLDSPLMIELRTWCAGFFKVRAESVPRTSEDEVRDLRSFGMMSSL